MAHIAYKNIAKGEFSVAFLSKLHMDWKYLRLLSYLQYVTY